MNTTRILYRLNKTLSSDNYLTNDHDLITVLFMNLISETPIIIMIKYVMGHLVFLRQKAANKHNSNTKVTNLIKIIIDHIYNMPFIPNILSKRQLELNVK